MSKLNMLAAVAAVGAAGLGGPTARANAQAPERIVDEAGRPTAVSSDGGVAVWSVFDEQSRRYTLHAWRDGAVVALSVKSRSVPFDADVGPDAHGEPVVVYSRCRTEPQVSVSFNELPAWAFGRRCDIYRYRFSDGREQRLKAASATRRSEVVPSIWGKRLAYFSVSEPNSGPRATVARLAIGGVVPGASRHWYRGGTSGPLDRFGKTLVDGPSPASLDLRGSSATYGWTNLATCRQGDRDSGGGWTASEVWEQTSSSRRRLARSCTAYGVFGAAWLDGTARWLRQEPAPAPRGTDVLVNAGSTRPLPAFASGAAIVGNEMFVARATETGPTQIVAVPAT